MKTLKILVLSTLSLACTFSSAQVTADFTFAITNCTLVTFTDQSTSPGTIVSWEWDFGDGSPGVFNANPFNGYASVGSYVVTLIAQDNLGARDTVTKSVNITVPTASISPATVTICAGGTATLTAGGGLSFQWSNAASTAAINVSPTSTTTYSVTVSDANGCTASASRTVTVNPNPTATISPGTAVICSGQSITLFASGGTAYLWSIGATNAAITVSPSTTTTYSVTTTNNNGCTATASRTVNVSPGPSVSITPVSPAICGGQSVTLTATASGGSSPYSYDWNTGSSTVTITVSPPTTTTYRVTVTDNNGCTTTASRIVTMGLSVGFNITSPSCSCDGTAKAIPAGGIPPYTYSWSAGTPANGDSVTGLCTGMATVTVTDSAGCSGIGNVMVQSSVLNVLASLTTITCYGSCDGSAQVTVSGGSQPYQYLWSNSATTTVVSNLCAGTYTVTITDMSGCSATQSITVFEPLPITLSINSSGGNCTSMGYACVNVSGGNPFYTYSWSNGSNTSCQQSLPPGTYSITVSDALGCTADTSVTITFNSFTVTDTSANPTCGNTDGFIAVSVSGGSGNFTYLWSSGISTDSVLTGLGAGSYTVTISDSTSGCSTTKSYTLFGSCGTVSGHVFNDINKNGVQDTGENGLPGISVELNPGGFTTVTNSNGNYSIGVGTFDTFSVSVNPPSRYDCSGTVLVPDSVTTPLGNNHTVIVTMAVPDVSGIDFGLTRPQQPCGTISGYVFDDLNGNGIDDGEPKKSGVSIQLSTGQYALTDFLGMYSVQVPFNIPVTVSIALPPGGYYCGSGQPAYVQTFPPFNGSYTVTLTTGAPNSTGNDFGINQSGATFDVGVFNISANAGNQAGRDFSVWMDYKSFGTSGLTCAIRLTHDPLVHFVSAAYAPTIVTNTYVEWEYAFGTAPDWRCMTMYFYLDSSATAGTILTWTGSYGCGTGDACPGNDVLTRTVTVISGPLRLPQSNGLNSMEVFHTGNAQNEITLADSVFSYVINFHNTTSDTAYHLTIVDTLSPYLNIESISAPFSSHAYRLHVPASNILIFEFDNILLPDSATDYLNSYGFVQYNIFMKPDLPQGTVIENQSALSFNYGEAYLTNTTSVTIFEALSVSANVTDVTCFEGSDGAIVLDPIGGTAPYRYSWSNQATTKDITNVSAGSYTVTITDANNDSTIITETIAEGFDVNAGAITGADSVQIDETATFSVNQNAGNTYTWTVTNGSIVSGQNSSSVVVDFAAAGQATLTAVVSAQGCTVTISKTVVTSESVGIISLENTALKIYPNPGNGIFTVEISEAKNDTRIRVYDLAGKMVLDEKTSALKIQLDLTTNPEGVYYVKVECETQTLVRKISLLH